jgi:hypothetical protein
MRAALAAIALAVAFFACAFAARPAFAQERRVEIAAKDALKKARADFQAQDYDTAVVRVRKALKACGTIRCTAATRAQLLATLGVMQWKRGDKSGASQSFADAIHTDPKQSLPTVYQERDTLAEWEAARDEALTAGQSQPAGDFETQPAQEQVENTPVPVYVELVSSQPIDRVALKYRGMGAPDWKRVDLPRKGKGWGGYIPCGDVKRGVLRYYVQGFDSSGAPVALSGDPKHPFFVPIRHSIATPAPALPGEAAPPQCGAEGAAPPAAPAESHAEEVPQCEDDSQCSTGVCEDGRCVEKTAGAAAPSRGYARWWVGVAGSFDVGTLPSADDVCRLTPQAVPAGSDGYYCTQPTGPDYPTRANPGENESLTPGQAGHVEGGPQIGNIRVLLAVDYAIDAHLLVGARFGYVAHGYTGTAAGNDGKGFTKPVHAEVRGTYLFGDEPLAHAGWAPMAIAAAGVAEFALEKDVVVRQGNAPLAVAGMLPKNAWRIGGPMFVAVGGGLRYGFSQRWGLTAIAKLSGAFGGVGFLPTIAPELTLQYGF